MPSTITIRVNRKILVRCGAILAAALVCWLALSPYFVVWRLQSAAGSQNADALSALVDFESVRGSLKEFLYSEWLATVGDDQDGFAALGATLGVMLVESLIDRFVTPHGLAALMRNPERGMETEGPPDDVIDDISTPLVQTRSAYESLNRFLLETWSADMDEQRVGFVLRRRGLSWRLTGLRLPLPPPEPVSSIAEEPSPSPELAPNFWHVTESVDPIDDTVTITAMLKENGERPWGSGPFLFVRCLKNKTEAFISWKGYLGIANTVSVAVRWDDETATAQRWSSSTSKTATFAPQPLGFVGSLMEHKRLVVRTTPYNDAPSTLVFDLTNESKRYALWRIAEACNWDLAGDEPAPEVVPDTKRTAAALGEEHQVGAPSRSVLPDVPRVPEPKPSILPEPTGPIYVTGDVTKPEKILHVKPQYTEIACNARVRGVAILQATIDKQGNVTDVKVLKGLAMGLSEAAVNAVKEWKFKPATLHGRPVAVYYNVTTSFDLTGCSSKEVAPRSSRENGPALEKSLQRHPRLERRRELPALPHPVLLLSTRSTR